MIAFRSARRATWGAAVIGLALAATPGPAVAASRARLVNCGDRTCLRISGHRSSSAVTIRIADQPVAVEGDQAWHATVPLFLARGGANASLDRLMLTMTDLKTGVDATEMVALPPGALGRRVELASLDVYAY
jgi:hypothetical protein